MRFGTLILLAGHWIDKSGATMSFCRQRRSILLLFFALLAGCASVPPIGSTSAQRGGLTTRCPGTSVWSGQGCVTSVSPSSSTDPRVAQTVRVEAATDRFQAAARDQLQKSYHKAPFPCSTFASSSGKDGYVVDMTRWAATAGLRRGDRPVAYGGIPLTGAEDSNLDVWARVPRGEYVDIRVERAGREVSIRLPCRDDREASAARHLVLRAVAEARWRDCIDAVSYSAKVAGYAPSSNLWVGILCMAEKSKVEKQRPPEEYWRRLHAWATKAIDEAHYRPTGLADMRARLLSVVEGLEKAGRNTLAEDVKQQIATFASTPPPTVTSQAPPSSVGTRSDGKSVLRVGTAFAVSPEGIFVTAFHVVKGAKVVELSCPDIGTERAAVERFSEANDLAVLRISRSKTPSYLSIADQKSVTLGQQVFTIGYPAPDMLGSEAKFTEGVVSSLSVGGDAGYMQISVPVQPGNSGGPLLNGSGEVIGIVVATASALSFLKGTGALPQNVSWAVKGAFAAPLFDASPVPQRVVDRDAAIRRALKSTCAVTVSAEAAE